MNAIVDYLLFSERVKINIKYYSGTTLVFKIILILIVSLFSFGQDVKHDFKSAKVTIEFGVKFIIK